MHTNGIKVVFGIPKEIKQIVNAPPGKQRLKMRPRKFTSLYVKTDDGIQHYALEDRGDCWHVNPALRQGMNCRLELEQ